MHFPGTESSTLEFKESLPNTSKLLQEAVAFANQYGGRIVIGVRDDGTIKGIDESQAEQLLEFINNTFYREITPPLMPLVLTQRFGDNVVLIIEVHEGITKPYHLTTPGLNEGTFVRVGRSSVRATADTIQMLQWASRGRFPDEYPVFRASWKDIDEQKFRIFLQNRKMQGSTPDLRKIALSYHIITEEQGREFATTAGILLFGKETNVLLPECHIVCSQFKGISGREALRSIDCTGTLFEQFEQAFEFTTSCLSKSFQIRSVVRTEEYEIPLIALREIFLNAVVHRDYSLKAPTKIAIFDDRIEVFSPGNFPGPLTLDLLEAGITYVRNAFICKVFREAGYIEKLGTGFSIVFRLFREAHLLAPVVIEGSGFVKCVLSRKKSSPEKTAVLPHDRALQIIKSRGALSIRDLSQELQISRATAGRILKTLIEANKIESQGRGPSTRYIIV
ncbi:MAG: RNA-binding domain-containing protein [Pseudomonadota bacterium]